METKKISEFEIEITKPAEIVVPAVATYDRSFIETQILSITKDRDNYVTLRNAELAECEGILSEMKKLGIVSKIVEQMPEEIINEVIA